MSPQGLLRVWDRSEQGSFDIGVCGGNSLASGPTPNTEGPQGPLQRMGAVRAEVQVTVLKLRPEA